VVLENGVVLWLDHPGVLGGVGELRVVHPQFGADGEAALGFDLLVAQFLPSGLNGKIGLPLSHDLLGRIGVLDDEVAGVARHHHGRDATLRTAADLDHFVDPDEMVFHLLPAVETGGAGLLDHRLEMAVIHVAEHTGKVAARPEFIARRIGAADLLKGCDTISTVGLPESAMSAEGAPSVSPGLRGTSYPGVLDSNTAQP